MLWLCRFGMAFASIAAVGIEEVLKISIFDSPKQRRLVLEGALIAPWAAELKKACEAARVDLDGRDLVVDLKSLMAISLEGEDILLDLMNDEIKLRSHGVFTQRVLRLIARKTRRKLQETKP
jgi:hypothetical protein